MLRVAALAMLLFGVSQAACAADAFAGKTISIYAGPEPAAFTTCSGGWSPGTSDAISRGIRS